MDLTSFFWYSLFPALLFLPGVFLSYIMNSLHKLKMGKIEIILTGALIWNFLLVVPSVVLGLVPPSLKVYFQIFTLISIFALFSFVFYFLLSFLKLKKKTTKVSTSITQLAYVIIIVLFVILPLSIFHTIYIEWDALFLYLPLAKSIMTTGGIIYDPYRFSAIFPSLIPPAIPITYAWILNEVGEVGLSTLPFMYFGVTLLTVFSVAKELFGDVNKALISTSVFVSFPAVYIVLASRSLYLDVPFILYAVLFVFFLTKAVKYNQGIWYLFSGIALSLLILTRDFGIFFVPIFLLLFIFQLKYKYLKVVSTIVFLSPFYLLSIFQIQYLSTVFSLFIWNILFGISIYSIGKIKNIAWKVSLKEFLLFIIPLFPVVGYLARNFLAFRNIFLFVSLNSSYQEVLNLFLQAGYNPGFTPFSYSDPLRIDLLFFAEGLGAPYVIPLLLSVGYFIYKIYRKKLQIHWVPVLAVFLLILSLWSFWFTLDIQPRRLYYFAPFFSILITEGFILLSQKFRKNYHLLIRASIYLIIVFGYIWFFKIAARKVNAFEIVYWGLGTQTLWDIIFYTSLFFLVFLIDIISPVRFHELKNNGKIIKSIKILIVIFIILFSIYSMGGILNDIAVNGYNLRHEVSDNWEYQMPQIISYYQKNIHDDYITVTFHGAYLIYFANRSVIEFTRPTTAIPLLPLLKETNETLIIQELTKQNIRYFLLPKPNNKFYNLYLNLKNNCTLFNIIEKNPNFTLIKEFTYYKLYKLNA